MASFLPLTDGIPTFNGLATKMIPSPTYDQPLAAVAVEQRLYAKGVRVIRTMSLLFIGRVTSAVPVAPMVTVRALSG